MVVMAHIMNVLIPLNCTVKMVKTVNFMLCVFYHNKKIMVYPHFNIFKIDYYNFPKDKNIFGKHQIYPYIQHKK